MAICIKLYATVIWMIYCLTSIMLEHLKHAVIVRMYSMYLPVGQILVLDKARLSSLHVFFIYHIWFWEPAYMS